MRMTVALVIGSLALLAWFTSAMWEEAHQPSQQVPFVRSDFNVCVRVNPGPLKPPRKDVFHPNANGELT
jgi:hypothetical protein